MAPYLLKNDLLLQTGVPTSKEKTTNLMNAQQNNRKLGNLEVPPTCSSTKQLPSGPQFSLIPSVYKNRYMPRQSERFDLRKNSHSDKLTVKLEVEDMIQMARNKLGNNTPG